MRSARWVVGLLLWLLAGASYIVSVAFEYLGDGLLGIVYWMRDR